MLLLRDVPGEDFSVFIAQRFLLPAIKHGIVPARNIRYRTGDGVSTFFLA